MKTLFLLRHAKSSQKGVSDFERPLNVRGIAAAKLIGEVIQKRKLTFDLVLSSPAVRARETTQLVLAAAKIQPVIRFDQRIYEAGPSRLLQVVSEIEPDVDTAVVVGHNPGLSELLQLLTGETQHMSTANLAKIDLENPDWGTTKLGGGTLDWILRPKELGD